MTGGGGCGRRTTLAQENSLGAKENKQTKTKSELGLGERNTRVRREINDGDSPV